MYFSLLFSHLIFFCKQFPDLYNKHIILSYHKSVLLLKNEPNSFAVTPLEKLTTPQTLQSARDG